MRRGRFLRDADSAFSFDAVVVVVEEEEEHVPPCCPVTCKASPAAPESRDDRPGKEATPTPKINK
jgi:hypothetical protein